MSHPFPPRLSTCVALTKLLYLFALRFLICEMGTPLVISTSRAIESHHTCKAFGVTPVLQGSRCQLSLYRRRGTESFLPQEEPGGFLQTPPLLSQLPSQGRFVDPPPSKTRVTSRIQPLGWSLVGGGVPARILWLALEGQRLPRRMDQEKWGRRRAVWLLAIPPATCEAPRG